MKERGRVRGKGRKSMRGLKSTKKDLIKKENAVSEIMGVALLLGIVVIMLSFEGAFIFSRSGPDDIPHAKLQEWLDTSEEKIYLKHCGGEPIKIGELEVVANINDDRHVYNSSNAYIWAGDNGYWELGEMLEINTSSEWGIKINDTDDVNLYLIDIPTKELIQKSRLTTDFRKDPYVRGWITPSGDVIDTSGGSANLSQVQEPNWEWLNNEANKNAEFPENYTTYHPDKKIDGKYINYSVYQLFDFGVNPCMYGFRPGDSLSNVTLKIVYRTKDDDFLRVELRFYDLETSSYTNQTVDLNDSTIFTVKEINLTEWVKTTEDLANFKVQIVAAANAEAEKEINIDYLGLWIE